MNERPPKQPNGKSGDNPGTKELLKKLEDALNYEKENNMKIHIESIENMLIEDLSYGAKDNDYLEGETRICYKVLGGGFKLDGNMRMTNNIDDLSMNDIKSMIKEKITKSAIGGKNE